MGDSPFQKAYEFEKRYGIDRLKLTIEKAEKAYQTYEPETIDYCKCIIESVCKHIQEEKEIEVVKNPDFHKLVGDTFEILGLEKGQIAGGIKSIALGICELRNEKGLAGHGQTDKCILPTKVEIDIFLATCSNILKILLALLDNQEVDILKTKLDFSILENKLKLEYHNQYIDTHVKVNYNQEEGTINIQGKDIHPSEILFAVDRLAYNEMLKEALNNLKDNSDYFEELILDFYLENPIDVPNIKENSYSLYVSEIYMQDDSIITKGSLSWDEIVYDPDSENANTISAITWFKASFSYEYDKLLNDFIYNIESLDFEQGLI